MTHTPDPRDTQTWHRLYEAASDIVQRRHTTAAAPTGAHLDALADAVLAVDSILFSDWWDRTSAEKAQRQQPDPRYVHDGLNKWVKCGPQCSLRVVGHGQAQCRCRGGQAHGY